VQQLPWSRNGGGRFFRGNLHTHSNGSDGGLSPAEVCAAYRRQGYDFLAITDHFMPEFDYPVTDTRAYRTDDFTTLLGAELHAPALTNGQVWHILGVGLPADFAPPAGGETGAELAERAVASGAFVGLAHPAWYGATIDDLNAIPHAHAIEVYNEVCAALTDRPESWYHVDQLLAAGRRVTAFGADDAHFRDFTDIIGSINGDGPEPETYAATLPGATGSGSGDTYPAGFSAWVWVYAERNDPEAIVESLKQGGYYTSQGPRIHDVSISADRREIIVSTSPAVSVYLTGSPARFTSAANHARQITRATFPLTGFHGSYCRVTVVDAAGKRAWSNPIWLD
jgi:hypothetical protein